MAKKNHPSLRDIEQEVEQFGTPKTAKEKAIIDAAVELFGRRGINGATTAEIAKLADVTERTLFRYFPSKKDLVKRVFFPLMLRIGLMRNWESFKTLLKTKAKAPTFETGMSCWRPIGSRRSPGSSARPHRLASELLQNEELRGVMSRLAPIYLAARWWKA